MALGWRQEEGHEGRDVLMEVRTEEWIRLEVFQIRLRGPRGLEVVQWNVPRSPPLARALLIGPVSLAPHLHLHNLATHGHRPRRALRSERVLEES